ncbi:hypothetical protein [Bacillus taeanensis]|uniref:hypothetical protein n=1 Tax=Bacillus taeanensis TaxID=273032 RepID=UPI0015F02B74|nr:hypothetical protein [Bacillus taeanensis]
MEQSIFMPFINQYFEIYYFSKHPQSYRRLKKHNKSAEKFSQLDSLFRLHSHDVMEVLVFLDGECEFFCEGKTY